MVQEIYSAVSDQLSAVSRQPSAVSPKLMADG
jgi:hypothetical protein